MAISKKIREAVYQKYGGRCAYCGRVIAYKDMQVDHFRPLRVWDEADGAADDISNLMPACRMCNHYKRANSLEVFRRYIAEIPRKLRGDYIYKIGVAYGNVVENEKPIEFFFETEEAKTSPGAAIMSPEDMAHYLMDLCHCRLAAGKGCPGCTTPRILAWLGSLHGVICVSCGHYAPTVKAWNREWEKKK